MRTIRLFKVWLVIGLMLLSRGSLAFAQFSDCGVNTCTNDKVGIGTTSPASALHVSGSGLLQPMMRVEDSGTVANPALSIKNDVHDYLLQTVGARSNNFEIWDQTLSATRLAITTSGNVGIGTTSPLAKLHIESSTPEIMLHETDGATDRKRIRVFVDAGLFTIDNPNDAYSGVNNLLNINLTTGNVGIGTASPTSKLHVAGNARITGDLTTDGNIAAKYQDVAEWVRAPALLSPGTVVVIDPLENNRVLAAFEPYDMRVAGVISSQPGIILGEAGKDKAKVAHSGRVKVKADARYGAIGVGDLLVTSSTSGNAMRSNPVDVNGVPMHRPGTIIGKALEPLREGQGEILVLVTLQ